MKVFLAYASEDRDTAERIYFALAGSGHSVFLDRTSLPPGLDFNARIREAVRQSDFLVFLISDDSVAEAAYPLTELSFAQKQWPHPAGCVVPVMARPTDLTKVPAYLRAVTILEPRGDIAAETADAIDHLIRERSLVAAIGKGAARHWQLLAATGAVSVAAALLVLRDAPPADPVASADLQREIAMLRSEMRALEAKSARTEDAYRSLSQNRRTLAPAEREELDAELITSLAGSYADELPRSDRAELDRIMLDPTLANEDKITLTIMSSMQDLDAEIEQQAAYLNSLQENPTAGVSIDVETMKLKRLIDQRSQRFDMLRQIIDKYNASAKGIIDSMGR